MPCVFSERGITEARARELLSTYRVPYARGRSAIEMCHFGGPVGTMNHRLTVLVAQA